LVLVWLSEQYSRWRYAMYHKVNILPVTPYHNLTSDSTACGPLQNAIEFDSLASNVGEYSYCSLFLGSASVPKCSACLNNCTWPTFDILPILSTFSPTIMTDVINMILIPFLSQFSLLSMLHAYNNPHLATPSQSKARYSPPPP
jgi:hypothetical protein